MTDAECITFLQSALPRLGLRWRGFRKVRTQVRKRINRRIRTLGLDSADAYRAYLDKHPEEWAELDHMCRITISRFYRDRGVFDRLSERVLPLLARRAEAGDGVVRVWSAGCASGEEVYTLRIVWALRVQPAHSEAALYIVATDANPHLLDRARAARYPAGTLRELPPDLREAAFEPDGEARRLRDGYRDGIVWLEQDIRTEMPEGPFDLILCRNLAFTYFEAASQEWVGRKLEEHLAPGGFLVVGKHETLPAALTGFEETAPGSRVWRKR